jgi:hypothetical protein
MSTANIEEVANTAPFEPIATIQPDLYFGAVPEILYFGVGAAAEEEDAGWPDVGWE